jgi:hypothetical protein
MPNDCTNSFTITNITTDQWRQFAATFQVRDSDEQQDFLKTFYPEPDYAITPVAQTYPEISAKYAKTEEERERILKNEPTIREDSWWDWRVQNWGTKWDVGGNDYNEPIQETPNKIIMSFDSAWAPPTTAMDKFEALGFSVRLYYYEPGMGFAGIYEDGHDDYYEYGGLNAEQIAEELPEALDEMFNISEDVAMWEEENAEEENIDIDLDGGLSATNEQEQNENK